MASITNLKTRGEKIEWLENLACDRIALTNHLGSLPLTAEADSSENPSAEELAWVDRLETAVANTARLEVLTDGELDRLAGDPSALLLLSYDVNDSFLSHWNQPLALASSGRISSLPPISFNAEPAGDVTAQIMASTQPASLGRVPPYASGPASHKRVFDWEWESTWEDLDWEKGREQAIVNAEAGKNMVVFRLQAFAQRHTKAGFWKMTIRGPLPTDPGAKLTLRFTRGDTRLKHSCPLKSGPDLGALNIDLSPWGDPTAVFDVESEESISVEAELDGKSYFWRAVDETVIAKLTQAFFRNWQVRAIDGYRSVETRMFNKFGRRREHLFAGWIGEAVMDWRRRAYVTTDIRNFFHFSSLVFMKAKNLAISSLRRDGDVVFPSDYEMPAPTQADQLDAIEQREIMKRVFARLPESQREVLDAVEMQGQTYAELSEKLGVPSNTLRQRFARGSAALRIALADNGRAK